MPEDKLNLRSCLPDPSASAAVALFWEHATFAARNEQHRTLISAIAGASPFLRQLMLNDGEYAARVFSGEPGA